MRKRVAKAKKVRRSGVRLRTTLQGELEAKAQLNRIEAFKMKVQGKSMRQIAEVLGVALSTVHGYLHAEAIELTAKEDKMRETYKSVEDARLTALIEKVLPIATADNITVVTEDRDGIEIRGDATEIQLKAVAQAIKLSERLSRLHGLDAPTKQEHSGPEGGPISYVLTKERQAQLAERGRRLLEMTGKPQPSAIIVGDN